jgi:hypothetical protein
MMILICITSLTCELIRGAVLISSTLHYYNSETKNPRGFHADLAESEGLYFPVFSLISIVKALIIKLI